MAAIFIFPPIPLDKTGLATEAKQDVQITELQDIEADLVAIAGYVDSIEANQATAQASLTAIDASLNSIEASNTSIELDTEELRAKLAAALVTAKHDYISMTYVGATTDIATVTYKDGGVAGTTVATLTLAYDGSNRLTSVTKA